MSRSVETIFLVLSLIQFLILLVQDTVNLFPLNDIKHLQESMSLRDRTLMFIGNTVFFLICLVLQIVYFGQPKPVWVGGYAVLLYGLNLYLMYQQWYKYYFFGAAAEVNAKYALEYGRTLHILPARGSNPRPNLLHLVLHVLFVCNTILAIIVCFNGV